MLEESEERLALEAKARDSVTKARDSLAKTGDRVAFVIRPGYKGEKTCMRAVTPDDVRNGRASADTRSAYFAFHASLPNSARGRAPSTTVSSFSSVSRTCA